ncbi:sigma-70 family RNA polymerase sigma factor [Achromobacter xylosoxidans]|uniref:sigma-70 family RNA polymerase sigma factor n=1 Tax=Alcaligenes xylosoxydans xylosoxydans TaxID=85698 RepID=UPI0006C3C65D|nr:sigma-70 family RNA polymerase sigma factor [Achromobacter xylosoxidans]MCZ8441727.1 sigma-70 family RNA polymerase sigma factor [Achromobacter xylosoxidans]MDC6160379.1 sigma-70 family RNA polymerase sigma factor [Achromobacter xylosoxidans]CUI48368.1 Probable RNA polymerase sigma factor fecI [Achromobacter xylosoxidans]CUK06746.1 Probable RNA polymerase sigma factor fecI [Achromobacter xylosoxidans]CUR68892.1 putative RNA polymerase sigma factor FecI [Achromobacter xylosoxidans]
MSPDSSPPDIHSLYQAHHGWLRSWLLRRLGNAFDAADLAHDAFVRLLAAPRAFDSPQGARAYLRSMGNGMCIDLWRRQEVERAWLDTLGTCAGATAPSAEQQAIIVETLLQVAQMLQQLPPKVARAFILAQVDGMKYRDIAAELGVSERTIKSYLARALLHCALLEASHQAAAQPRHFSASPSRAPAAP